MRGYLLFEDGTKFEGEIFGYQSESVGEVVFNTGMTGYQEILTDPSYYGQIVVMTYPLIGNYGVNSEDLQSSSPKVKGFIVREIYDDFSNWRGEENLKQYLVRNKIVGLKNIDTRALTKFIRERGSMAGKIVINRDYEKEDILQIKQFKNNKAVEKVTTKEIYNLKPKTYKVAVLDFGVKKNILNSLLKRNMELIIYPAFTPAEKILEDNPDGIFLSNGPGDPAELTEIIENIKKLIGKKPMFGICLGHQLISLALGFKTIKLKYGHRGTNHPVKDLVKNKIYITSQNHGYVVEESSLNEEVIITHVNLNDGSIEGLRHKTMPLFSVQFHPEASPGPHDTAYLFDEFKLMIQREEL
ncbi:carbamoyl-phosphate synthase small subunit [Caminicella sporogenes DSM 14501]|uniref:Carbamoyl phosphate synthase small chain n=1 Tax=Caminicella sporogenes DSM 14501 TaxID=1121266 RepID=A0A1M6QX40_9FIRM|nr:carbamoyl phosphate synthase small subunit [Caminicella sporogenes]RKD20879.1 carbamoyl phosphate synthase small subunit [Caminicella sporogenes]WIF95725.1 carbamoyl phosphate synthase small subunit [Caminicella sporogenes]SHK24637.1 carbamoyl-phosphate synthase small subunit [Caminicella sporogenes DSM 14501]